MVTHNQNNSHRFDQYMQGTRNYSTLTIEDAFGSEATLIKNSSDIESFNAANNSITLSDGALVYKNTYYRTLQYTDSENISSEGHVGTATLQWGFSEKQDNVSIVSGSGTTTIGIDATAFVASA